MIATLARAARGPRIDGAAIAFPNFSLEDHWQQGDAISAIARGGWTTVVLQQGPSALPESRVLLREYTRKFADAIQRIRAVPALYMVWPSSARFADFDDVRTSYQLAARDVRGLFLPVGEAWRTVWKRDARVELYGPDGFHPTPTAAYLAALVIYQRLTGRSLLGTPAPVAMPPARAALLQRAAADTNAAL
jgi:hypothetical protein